MTAALLVAHFWHGGRIRLGYHRFLKSEHRVSLLRFKETKILLLSFPSAVDVIGASSP